ncbi:MAG: hypothetical protein A2487_06965 [Candidatus Raymondbacteria bacterium RifOxyC12_full_50_8]|nr:MAG: hypothetical protein A2487_06965 [Candidatus Raymondbacteria bacterium RifOxyC12_full_50_8]
MEQSFGGCCLYMTGGSGTCMTNPSRFTKDYVVAKAMDTLPHLEFKTVDKMAVVHTWMGWRYGAVRIPA